ncbi:sugar ABC transporter substrate-binding protein [candidate division KSB1 bacterium]|nr:sugar ABC transporter substrate-binding protein [candidate division KSB1 bacterium]
MMKQNRHYLPLLLLGLGALGGWFLFTQYPKNPQAISSRLRFVSLAWQEQAIAANQQIVADWNANHPQMPVEYIQGSWNAIHDYLITSFETNEVPDIFHYESAIIVDFAQRGFLADLAPEIDEEMRQDILDVAWASVTRPDGAVCGIPFLMESFIVLYNQDIFQKNGISVPTFDQPWSWDDLRHNARKLTRDTNGDGKIDQWGVAMGLRNAANIIMNHAISFGGSFFTKTGQKYVVHVGAAEKQLLNNIMELLYQDQSMAPSSIGKTGAGMIPEFLAGKYALMIGIGSWARQQLVENAPAGFQWGVIPPLKAESQNIGINTQTLSIPSKSKRKQAAMAFIKFMLNQSNLAKLAASDWMIPTRKSCLEMEQFRTPEDGWQIVNASVKFLASGSWLGVPGYVEWKTRVANPILQELFANRYTVAEAAARIELESNLVLSRYQRRGGRHGE